MNFLLFLIAVIVANVQFIIAFEIKGCQAEDKSVFGAEAFTRYAHIEMIKSLQITGFAAPLVSVKGHTGTPASRNFVHFFLLFLLLFFEQKRVGASFNGQFMLYYPYILSDGACRRPRPSAAFILVVWGAQRAARH